MGLNERMEGIIVAGGTQGNPGMVEFTPLAGRSILNVCFMCCPGHWAFSSPRKLCEREAAVGKSRWEAKEGVILA